MYNKEAGRAGDPEGIHQMRVAVRRLRGILSAFAPLLPPEHRRWASNELRWFADVLGEARNLDVLAAELLGPARVALPAASEFERLIISRVSKPIRPAQLPCLTEISARRISAISYDV
jgi:CHAD domain-containing protein